MYRYLFLLSVSLAPLSAAAIGVNTTPAGSAFASACAGTNAQGSAGVGYAPNAGVTDQYLNCNVQTVSSGLASVSASKSGTANGNAFSASADSQAGLGVLKLKSSDSGSGGTSFSGGEGNAGFNEQFTITGGTGDGVWVTKIHLDGSMSVSGVGALGRVELAVYKNGSILQGYAGGNVTQAYNIFTSQNVTHNGTIGSSWDFQMVAFQVTDYGPGDSLTLTSMTVDKDVYFAIPFTYGTPFTAGYWMSDMSGQIYAGQPVVANTATLDFSHTATWGGKGYVVDGNGNVATNFTLNSSSGFDYNNAVIPEPGTFGVAAVAGLALGLLGKLRRTV